jgi:hypothetical protein
MVSVSHVRPVSAPTTTIGRRHITIGKKTENDFEVSNNGVKKEARPNRVPLAVNMAQLNGALVLPLS